MAGNPGGSCSLERSPFRVHTEHSPPRESKIKRIRSEILGVFCRPTHQTEDVDKGFERQITKLALKEGGNAHIGMSVAILL